MSTHRRPAVEAIRAVAGTGCHVFYAGNAFTAPRSRRNERHTKYARDGRVDVAVFVLVLTDEHEYRHFVVLPAFHSAQLRIPPIVISPSTPS